MLEKIVKAKEEQRQRMIMRASQPAHEQVVEDDSKDLFEYDASVPESRVEC